MTAQLRLGWGVIAVFAALTASASLAPTQLVHLVHNKVEAISPVEPESPIASLSAEQAALARHLADKYDKPVSLARRIVASAYSEGAKRGLSPLLILAIIEKESSLEPRVTNGYGAKGLMQVVPRFHRDKLQNVAHPDGLLNPETNIRVGTAILAEYIDAHDGNLEKGLKKYSGNAKNYFQRVAQFNRELDSVRRRADSYDV